MAPYEPQKARDLRGSWDEENKVRLWPSASCLPHRTLGPVCPDQGSDGLRSDVSGRAMARAVPGSTGLEDCPGHSLCTLNSEDRGKREEPQAALRICSALADTMEDPIPGRSKGLVTNEGVWG